MNRKLLFTGASLLVTTLMISACSGGGGGSGGGSSSAANRASGPLSVPNATCGGNSCLNNASIMNSPLNLSSNTAVLGYAEEIYTHFTDTIIPGINGLLYKIEQAAADEGLTTCADIAGQSDAVGVDLGSGYTVDIATGDRTIPAPMTDSSSAMSKKYLFKYNTVAFAETQIFCNSLTQRTFYIRLKGDGTDMYEFWSQVDGNKRTIFGAMDTASTQKYTIYFNTIDGNAFQLHAIGNQISYEGYTIDFTVAGGVNLTGNVADIAYTNNANTVPTSIGTAMSQDNAWAGSDIRHCYNSLTAGTVTGMQATCNTLLSAAPTPLPIRTSAATWDIAEMAANSIDASF